MPISLSEDINAWNSNAFLIFPINYNFSLHLHCHCYIISLCRCMVTGCDSVYNNGDMSLPLNKHTFMDPPRIIHFYMNLRAHGEVTSEAIFLKGQVRVPSLWGFGRRNTYLCVI